MLYFKMCTMIKRIDYKAFTQMYHFNYRWYDPVIGRFIQQEPLGLDGPNQYHFCFNNPVNGFDPNGLQNQILEEYTWYGYMGNSDPLALHPLTSFERLHYQFGMGIRNTYNSLNNAWNFLNSEIWNPSIGLSGTFFFNEFGMNSESAYFWNLNLSLGGGSVDFCTNRENPGLIEAGVAIPSAIPIGPLIIPSRTISIGVDLWHGGRWYERPLNVHVGPSINILIVAEIRLKLFNQPWDGSKSDGLFGYFLK